MRTHGPLEFFFLFDLGVEVTLGYTRNLVVSESALLVEHEGVELAEVDVELADVGALFSLVSTKQLEGEFSPSHDLSLGVPDDGDIFTVGLSLESCGT